MVGKNARPCEEPLSASRKGQYCKHLLRKKVVKRADAVETSGSMMIERVLFNVVRLQSHVARSADDFMFGGDCCEEILL